MTTKMRLRSLLVSLGALLLLAGLARAETISWNVDSDGSWHTAGNWDLGRVPQAGDDVVIDRSAGSFTVTYSAGTTAVNSLTCTENLVLSGGSLSIAANSQAATIHASSALTLAADLDVSGRMTWTAGHLVGPGRLLLRAGIAVTGSGQKVIDGQLTVESFADSVWDGGRIVGRGDSRFVNHSGSTFDMRIDEEWGFTAGGSTFENRGTYLRSAGAGVNRLPTLENHGTVDVRTGTLRLQGAGSTNTGQFVTAAGTLLEFHGIGTTHDFSASASITAGGDVLFNSVAANVGGTFSVAGDTRLFQASVMLSQGGSTGSLEMDGYSLTTQDDLQVTGRTTFKRGGINGPGRLLARDGLDITTAGQKVLDGQITIESFGDSVWDGGRIVGRGDSRFVNHSGSTFDMRIDEEWGFTAGGSTFENRGTYLRSAGAGVNRLPTLENHGTVDVRTGTLRLQGAGSTNTGQFVTAAGTLLEFHGIGSTHDFSAMASITAGGDVLFNSVAANVGGALSVAGDTRLLQATVMLSQGGSTGTLDMDGYALATQADLVVTDRATWRRGSIVGPGRLLVDGGIALTTTGLKTIDGQLTLECGGASYWDGGNVNAGGGSVLRNRAAGTFEIRGDLTWRFRNTGSTIDNEGDLAKTSGTGTATLSAFVNNRGSVRLDAGTLILGGGTHAGSFTSAADTVLHFGGGHAFGASSIDADGDVIFSGQSGSVSSMTGPFDVAGDTKVTANIEFTLEDGATNTLTIEPGGRLVMTDELTVSGLFTWTGGFVKGAGKISAFGGIEMGPSSFELNGTIDNHATANWNAGRFAFRNGGVFNNRAGATFDIRADERMSHSGADATFNNDGTLEKSAGAGLTEFSCLLNNRGPVNVTAGTLAIRGGGSSTAAITGAAGTTIRFTGGTFDFSATSSIASAGKIIFSGVTSQVDGTVQIDGLLQVGTLGGTTVTIANAGRAGALNVLAGTLILEGDFDVAGSLNMADPVMSGDLEANAVLTVGGLFVWETGALRGTGRTLANGGIQLSGNRDRTLSGHTLDNAGSAVWTGTARIRGNLGAVFNNLAGATFDAQNDERFFFDTPALTFNNDGTFVKSAGVGTTELGLTFVNRGTMDVRTGTVLVTTFTQTAGATILAGGTIASSSVIDLRGGVLEGAGTVDADLANAGTVRPGRGASVGLLTVTGDYSGAGSVEIEIAGASDFDRLAMNGAAGFDAGSTLDLVPLGGFVPASTDLFLVMPYTSYTGNFETVNGTVINAVKTFLLDYAATGGLTLTVDGDDTPPEFGDVTADPDRLWPPDHQMKDVTITVEVTDDAGEPVTLTATVESSEGTNSHEPDWTEPVIEIDDDTGTITLQLRSERDGTGDDRTYTITITATDSSGNEAETTVTVTVPHDESK